MASLSTRNANSARGPPSTAQRDTRRSPRKLTREERSKIRILADHGVVAVDISKHLDRSLTAIYNVLNGRCGDDDEGDEYDFVDEEFKTEYPPPKNRVHKRIKLEHEDGTESTKERTAEQIRTSGNVNAQPIKLQALSAIRNRSRPIAGPSQQRAPAVIDLDPDSEPEIEEILSVMPTIDKFLENLDHDLTVIKSALEAEDLGTSDKLLAIAHWPEEKLHGLFKEALPVLTVPQRFMLIKGMKEYDMV